MKKIQFAILFSAIALFAFQTSFSQTTPLQEIESLRKKIESTGKEIEWEVFDPASKVSIDKIQPELLQGEWKAYNGFFRFGDMINSMDLTTPMTIEFKDNKYRRSKDSKYAKFELTKNQLISKKENDFGIINKITDNLLVITWKDDGNYTRYYYEK